MNPAGVAPFLPVHREAPPRRQPETIVLLTAMAGPPRFRSNAQADRQPATGGELRN